MQPQALNHFQQLNAATINAVPAVPLGQALDYLKSQADQLLPDGYSVDYAGQSRQYVQEGGSLFTAFVFGACIIFLVLAAQFESFRDPFIILLGSVPMTLAGAMVFLFLGASTSNIYTKVGLITLVGLIAKHGILIVQFANQLRRDMTAGFDLGDLARLLFGFALFAARCSVFIFSSSWRRRAASASALRRASTRSPGHRRWRRRGGPFLVRNLAQYDAADGPALTRPGLTRQDHRGLFRAGRVFRHGLGRRGRRTQGRFFSTTTPWCGHG